MPKGYAVSNSMRCADSSVPCRASTVTDTGII
jgi:hypothetical protein